MTETESSDIRKQMNYQLIKNSDMHEEMRVEAAETIVSAVEKYSQNYENAARMVKETMDKKFGGSWNCVIGEGFGFQMTHDQKHLLYMFFGVNAVLLWKTT